MACRAAYRAAAQGVGFSARLQSEFHASEIRDAEAAPSKAPARGLARVVVGGFLVDFASVINPDLTI